MRQRLHPSTIGLRDVDRVSFNDEDIVTRVAHDRSRTMEFHLLPKAESRQFRKSARRVRTYLITADRVFQAACLNVEQANVLRTAMHIAREQCQLIVGQTDANRHTSSLRTGLWRAERHAQFTTQHRSI